MITLAGKIQMGAAAVIALCLGKVWYDFTHEDEDSEVAKARRILAEAAAKRKKKWLVITGALATAVSAIKIASWASSAGAADADGGVGSNSRIVVPDSAQSAILAHQ